MPDSNGDSPKYFPRTPQQTLAAREFMANGLEARAGLPTEQDPHTDAPDAGSGIGPGQLKRRKALTTQHLTMRVGQLMEMFGFNDPIHVMMEIANGKETFIAGNNPDGTPIYGTRDFKKTPDHKTRVMAAAELASYLYPKRKSVELSGAEGQPISFQVVQDNTEIPVMPSAEELEAMAKERRQQIIDGSKMIDARVEE